MVEFGKRSPDKMPPPKPGEEGQLEPKKKITPAGVEQSTRFPGARMEPITDPQLAIHAQKLKDVCKENAKLEGLVGDWKNRRMASTSLDAVEGTVLDKVLNAVTEEFEKLKKGAKPEDTEKFDFEITSRLLDVVEV